MTINAEQCPICNGLPNAELTSTERYYSMGGEFRYSRCGDCGSLRLINIPSEIAPYYPLDKYYSFMEHSGPKSNTKVSLRRRIAIARNSAQLFGVPFWARPLAALRPWKEATNLAAKYLSVMPKRRSLHLRVLDVGCGSGKLLQRFDSLGFVNLEGIEPHLQSVERRFGIHSRIRRKTLPELTNETYDLIICDHVLEHIFDQRAALKDMVRLLAEGGTIRIEVPVADCDAFAEYGSDWIELDPPRHLFLHTRASLRMLAKQTGLEVAKETEEGCNFEFWGSEMYRQGVGFYNAKLERDHTASDLFSSRQINDFSRRSAEANANRRGGRVAMTLRQSNRISNTSG